MFPLPLRSRLVSLALVAVILLASVSARAAPPDTLPALKVLEASGGVLDVTLTLAKASGPTMIGSTSVDSLHTMTVCRTGSPTECADPYASAALKLQPGDTLTAHLVNTVAGDGGPMRDMCMDTTAAWDPAQGWTSTGGLINQHFHGLLVPPIAGQPGNAAKPFGDYIFTCAYSTGGDAERLYAIKPQIGHPLGIDWFHPHIHGIAKPQVASGMAGMILIGDPQCSDPSQCGNVRPILLKDAQLVHVTLTNGTAHWLNFADQNPDFCGTNKRLASNVGACAWDGAMLSSGGTDLVPDQGRWSFTLNGTEYPTLVVDTPQVWRIQNASANITYKLSLRRLEAGPGSVVGDAPFEVISMDGAGLAGSAGTGPLAPRTREILLMPGSRADLRVSRPDDGATGDLAYQLVNEAFQAGFTADDADTWPHIALAHVVFAAPPTALAASTAPNSATPELRRLAAAHAPLRLPVQNSGPAMLRGTPASRALATGSQNTNPSNPLRLQTLPPEPPAAPVLALPAPGAHGSHTRPLVVAPVLSGTRRDGLDRLFAMASWLKNDCDGYGPGDPLSAFDTMLAQPGSGVTGHHAIGNDQLRRLSYWTAIHFDPVTTHRRIYFSIGNDGEERFLLGETYIRVLPSLTGPHTTEMDLWGRPITPGNPVVLTTFGAEKGLCVLKRMHNASNPLASVEQWELVNVSHEVHNFHIHQMKFTVARDKNGQPILRTPSTEDLVQLPASLLLTAGGGAQAELQHDTIVVPRGVSACAQSVVPIGVTGTGDHAVHGFRLDRSPINRTCTGLDHDQIQPPPPPGTPPDNSGMILLNLAFDGDWLGAQKDGANVWQPARFVFHCHILEHEDKGMMHRIAVLDSTIH